MDPFVAFAIIMTALGLPIFAGFCYGLYLQHTGEKDILADSDMVNNE